MQQYHDKYDFLRFKIEPLLWLPKAHLITAISTEHPGRELRPCASHRLQLPRLLLHHNAGSTLQTADYGRNLMLKANRPSVMPICVCVSITEPSILYTLSSVFPAWLFRSLDWSVRVKVDEFVAPSQPL